MFKPGDIVTLTDEAIRNYKSYNNQWWKHYECIDVSELRVLVTKVNQSHVYGKHLSGKSWGNARVGIISGWRLAGPPPTKEERLLAKIHKLYKKCPSTSHWTV